MRGAEWVQRPCGCSVPVLTEEQGCRRSWRQAGVGKRRWVEQEGVEGMEGVPGGLCGSGGDSDLCSHATELREGSCHKAKIMCAHTWCSAS